MIYAAIGGHIIGFNFSVTQVYDSGSIGSPDGTGAIAGNKPFAGDMIANGNNGDVWLLDPTENLPGKNVSEEIIASGGSRGGYVGIDGTNGSLFLSQTDSELRLPCGANCTFRFATAIGPRAWHAHSVDFGFGRARCAPLAPGQNSVKIPTHSLRGATRGRRETVCGLHIAEHHRVCRPGSAGALEKAERAQLLNGAPDSWNKT